MPWNTDKKEARARIGARPSARQGERSALRWLSKLLRQHPEAGLCSVDYTAPLRGKRREFAVGYNRSTGSLYRVYDLYDLRAHPGVQYVGFAIIEDNWWPMLPERVHAVASRGGTLASFGRRHIRSRYHS